MKWEDLDEETRKTLIESRIICSEVNERVIYHFKPYDRETDEIGLDKQRYMDLLNAEIKLEEIKSLMRNHPRIIMNQLNQYYIELMTSSEGYTLTSEIMRLLYPDNVSQFTTKDDEK